MKAPVTAHVKVLPQFELIGPEGGPLVVVLGGISATRHVAASDVNPAPGWWDSVVGPGRAIDTTRVRVLGVEFSDGGCGEDGRPQRIVSTADQAASIVDVVDHLGVRCVHAVVGASYGGMVALAFAERYPERVSRLVVISAAHEPHPMTTAWRALQRRIVGLGIDTGDVQEALSLARGLAMTTYRSAREFGERFGTAPVERTTNDAIFPVEGYLRQHGERFAALWTPERFLALSLSADLHCVDPGAIHTPTLLVAAEDDSIVPRSQMEALAARFGGPCRLVDLPSTRGHDAFLTEPETIGQLIADSLATAMTNATATTTTTTTTITTRAS